MTRTHPHGADSAGEGDDFVALQYTSKTDARTWASFNCFADRTGLSMLWIDDRRGHVSLTDAALAVHVRSASTVLIQLCPRRDEPYSIPSHDVALERARVRRGRVVIVRLTLAFLSKWMDFFAVNRPSHGAVEILTSTTTPMLPTTSIGGVD